MEHYVLLKFADFCHTVQYIMLDGMFGDYRKDLWFEWQGKFADLNCPGMFGDLHSRKNRLTNIVLEYSVIELIQNIR